MSWIISLISLVLLVIESMIGTFFILIALNGFPSLPNAFISIFLVCIGTAILGLSALSGYLAQKLAGATPLPLWLAGILTIFMSLIILPIFLLVLIMMLLVVFEMT